LVAQNAVKELVSLLVLCGNLTHWTS